MSVSGVADAGLRWFTLQSGHYAGEDLMRGSARVHCTTDGFIVVAWMKSKRQTVPVWQGIDPFRGGEIAEQINGREKFSGIRKKS